MTSASIARRRLLDPRPPLDAVPTPIDDAVNLPAAEIPARAHELPPRTALITIANTGPDASAALAIIEQLGRRAVLCGDFELGGAPAPPGRLWSPAEFLEAVAPSLRRGRALDLACGSGRESVYLASLGFEVLGVDILPDALAKARDLAERYDIEPPPQFARLDLESDDFDFDEPFDLIIAFRYLHRPLFAKIPRWLAPGGILVYETFTTLHRERFGKPARDAFVLAPGELPTLTPALNMLQYDEGWHDGAHTARLLAQHS